MHNENIVEVSETSKEESNQPNSLIEYVTNQMQNQLNEEADKKRKARNKRKAAARKLKINLDK